MLKLVKKNNHGNHNLLKFHAAPQKLLDKVFHDNSPIFVTRANGEDVVVMSKADYESMLETFYLLKSPKNAERLLKGIEEFEKGLGEEKNSLNKHQLSYENHFFKHRMGGLPFLATDR
ncbi:type II toxin-antitoxin system Phd/YefM family antitoxin [Cecembia rubra]|uniref:type II toxin-antitoxin system Phd/YefM family antitoxin n=1 Tax=Cecembia rubra TaxID=1485585 RepID=UPI002714B791|nr:type II toxin-antitoxin system prevent-host-death family antitoxin [Cecembia rubra]